MTLDNVKMSKIMEHIHDHRSDNLYNPLRNALNKSGMPMHQRDRRSSVTPDKVQNSHITKDIHMISAMEADKIRKSTFISSDRELIATKHLNKVYGKHFYAVDVEERVGEPISAEQFQKAPKYHLEQIVYQYGEDQVRSSQPVLQYRGGLYQSITQDKSRIYQPRTQQKLNSIPSYQTGIEGQQKVELISHQKTGLTCTFVEQPSYLSRPVSQQNYLSSFKSYQINPNMNEKSQLSQYQSQQDHGKKEQKYKRPTLVGLNPSQMSHQGITKINRGSKQAKSSSDLNSLMMNSRTRSYQFDKKLTSARINKDLLKSRNNDNYKYNLFSMLDQPGNLGCKPANGAGCFINNEVVASKRSGTQWN